MKNPKIVNDILADLNQLREEEAKGPTLVDTISAREKAVIGKIPKNLRDLLGAEGVKTLIKHAEVIDNNPWSGAVPQKVKTDFIKQIEIAKPEPQSMEIDWSDDNEDEEDEEE